MAATENLLEIVSLSAYYSHPEKLALENVSLQVRRGEIVSLIGPNGAGKSTVLKAIFKEVRIKEGVCLFEGEDLAGRDTTTFPLIGIRFVPEGRRLFQSMTVEENLDTGGYVIKDGREVSRRKERVYSLFPVLKDRRNILAKKLSGGEQQMLSFGGALMTDPKLLLMDEPSIGLAPQFVDMLFDQVKTIHQTGAAILLVEQNVRKALEVAERVYVLNLGQVELSGRPEEVRENDRIKNIYLGG